MKKSLAFTLSLAAAVVAGLLLGSIWPEGTKGASLKEFWFDVPVRGTEGASAQVSCGWHWTACPNGDDGRALDWDSYPSPQQYTVYLRGGGLEVGVGGTIRSYGVPRSAPGEFTTCNYNVFLDVYNFSTGDWQVSIGYTHTRSPDTYRYMVYGNPTYNNTGSRIASMATSSDPWGCGWSGPHPHVFECACSPIGVATNYSGFPSSNSVHCCYNNRTWVQYYQWYD